MSEKSSTFGRRGNGRLSLATSHAFHSPTISLFEALDALASQLLALGWVVRMPRTSWDCEVGVLVVSARAFGPTTCVQLDSGRHLSLVRDTGEQEPVYDISDLVFKLRRCQATDAASQREAVPA